MDTRILEYFIEIANESSLSAAAKKLYISQPALSQQLKKLESQIGTPLFERNGNSISLTDAGKIFLNGAQSSMHVKNKAYQQISLLKQRAADSIECMIHDLFINDFCNEVLPVFRQSFPHISVHPKPAARSIAMDYLLNGLTDFAVIIPPDAGHPALETISLTEDEIVLVLPRDHPYFLEHPVPEIRDLSLLASESWILSPPATYMRSVEDGILDSHQVSPERQYIGRDCDSIQYMAGDKIGIAFLPVSKAKKCPELAFYRIDPTVTVQPSIVYNKSRVMTPSLDFLFRLITELFQAEGNG